MSRISIKAGSAIGLCVLTLHVAIAQVAPQLPKSLVDPGDQVVLAGDRVQLGAASALRCEYGVKPVRRTAPRGSLARLFRSNEAPDGEKAARAYFSASLSGDGGSNIPSFDAERDFVVAYDVPNCPVTLARAKVLWEDVYGRPKEGATQFFPPTYATATGKPFVEFTLVTTQVRNGLFSAAGGIESMLLVEGGIAATLLQETTLTAEQARQLTESGGSKPLSHLSLKLSGVADAFRAFGVGVSARYPGRKPPGADDAFKRANSIARTLDQNLATIAAIDRSTRAREENVLAPATPAVPAAFTLAASQPRLEPCRDQPTVAVAGEPSALAICEAFLRFTASKWKAFEYRQDGSLAYRGNRDVSVASGTTMRPEVVSFQKLGRCEKIDVSARDWLCQYRAQTRNDDAYIASRASRSLPAYDDESILRKDSDGDWQMRETMAQAARKPPPPPPREQPERDPFLEGINDHIKRQRQEDCLRRAGHTIFGGLCYSK